MSKYQMEFAIVLARELNTISPFTVADLACKLMSAATSLHRRYEAECNHEFANTEAYQRMTKQKEDAIVKLLQPYAIKVIFNADPRGTPVRLVLLSGRTNDWCGEGFCVPTK